MHIAWMTPIKVQLCSVYSEKQGDYHNVCSSCSYDTLMCSSSTNFSKAGDNVTLRVFTEQC